MDLIYFLIFYVLLFAFILLTFKYMPNVARRITSIIYVIVPERMLSSVNGVICYIFFERNHIIQVVYCGLVVIGHVLLTLDVLPLLYIQQPEENHITTQLIILFVNSIVYVYTSTTNPGVVKKQHVSKYSKIYHCDGVLYKDNVMCSTCKFVKPARSKHCSYCDQCVFRFDHHCVWSNSCIGGHNIHYFLAFLLSVIAMCVNGTALIIQALLFYIHHTKMLQAQFMDHAGVLRPVTYPIIFQNLFMHAPRIIVLLLVSGSFAVMVTIFMLYHLYLVATNQTTNERYKDRSLCPSSFYNPYDRGVFSNITELFGYYPTHETSKDLTHKSFSKNE